jgi:hypothetical protein
MTYCAFCGRRLVVADDGVWVDADAGASGCADSFEFAGGCGEHGPTEAPATDAGAAMATVMRDLDGHGNAGER